MSSSSLPNGRTPSAGDDSSKDPQPPEWEGEVPDCNNCKKPFKLTRRRHHCRGCGRCFCDDCTTKRFELPPSFNTKGKQRVCDDCYFLLLQNEVESNPDKFPARPDPDAIRASTLQRVQQVLSEPEELWVKKAENKCVTIFTKKLKGSSVHLVRTISKIPVPVETAWEVYNNKDLWSNWQPDMKECRSIERLSPTEEVIYVVFVLPVLDNRDLVYFSMTVDGTIQDPALPRARTLMGCSVTHPLAPTTKGLVRAEMAMSLTTFTPSSVDGQDHTILTTVVHVDIKGLVPPMIINQAVSHSADQIMDMIEFMKSYKP